LSVGIAWNDAYVDNEIREKVPGAQDRARALVTGFRYDTNKLYCAGIYTWQDGNEVARTDSLDYIYSCSGIEIFAHFFPLEAVRIHGGLNLRIPRDPHSSLPENFGLRHYMIGTAFYLHPTAYLYSEFLYDNSIYSMGEDGENVLTLGIWINFASPRRKN
jgi:hypothetical protein